MSQVVIEFAEVVTSSGAKDTPVSHFYAQSEEITSSGTSQATTLSTTHAPRDNVVTVINNGTDTVWVNFGAAATAASPSRIVPPNTVRDFGNVLKNTTVSVINDS